MSVGRQVDKMTIDGTLGTLAAQIQTWSSRIQDFKQFIDTLPDADLEQPPYGYTTNEIALLKSSVNDMNTLALVYLGKEELTPARDLSTFVARVAGIPAVI